jgi:hypothetical protein
MIHGVFQSLSLKKHKTPFLFSKKWGVKFSLSFPPSRQGVKGAKTYRIIEKKGVDVKVECLLQAGVGLLKEPLRIDPG